MALHSPSSPGDDNGGYKYDAEAVFIDTSLNTHLAILTYSSYTVSHLKKKIMLEHSLCFPTVGQIQIHTVKVRRDSKWYHLPDSMFVRCAFRDCRGGWYLSIDASVVTEIKNPHASNSPASS